MLKAASKDFIEVVEKMLQWEPERRISMTDIKKLKFFEGGDWGQEAHVEAKLPEIK